MANHARGESADVQIDIHRANDAEIDALLSIWKRRAQRLIDQNLGMWELEQFSRESLRDKYGDPEYYVGCLDGKAFGGFILIGRDERYWPGKNDSAYYFHKFAVDEEYAGRGLSGAILNWVKEYGKANGKAYIRLDFEEDRAYLANMYYGNGFVKKGFVLDGRGKEITVAEYRIPARGERPRAPGNNPRAQEGNA